MTKYTAFKHGSASNFPFFHKYSWWWICLALKPKGHAKQGKTFAIGYESIYMKITNIDNQSSSNDLVSRMGYTPTARLIDQIGCGQDRQLTNSSTLIYAPLKYPNLCPPEAWCAPGNILYFLMNIIFIVLRKKRLQTARQPDHSMCSWNEYHNAGRQVVFSYWRIKWCLWKYFVNKSFVIWILFHAPDIGLQIK